MTGQYFGICSAVQWCVNHLIKAQGKLKEAIAIRIPWVHNRKEGEIQGSKALDG